MALEESRERLYEYEVTSGAVNAQSLFGLQMDSRPAGLFNARGGCL